MEEGEGGGEEERVRKKRRKEAEIGKETGNGVQMEIGAPREMTQKAEEEEEEWERGEEEVREKQGDKKERARDV